MSKSDDGGPAFPREEVCASAWGNFPVQPGMSLRDWFAGQVAQGMAAHSGTTGHAFRPEGIAERSYEVADAMLAERAKKGGSDE